MKESYSEEGGKMGEKGEMLHIAMFPWLAFGHMLPFLQLSKRIAELGHKISFISTPRNIQRLPKIPPRLSSNITFVSLPLIQVDNLPQDAEATSDISLHQVPDLKLAYDGLEDSLSQFLQTSSPDWLICDFAPYWLPPIAAKLNISCALFCILQAWTLTFFGSSKTSPEGEDNKPLIKPENFTVPPPWVTFPSKVALKIHEAKRFCKQIELNEPVGVSDAFRFNCVMKGSEVVCLRSCVELEPDFLSLFCEITDKPVFPVGLLPPEEAQEEDDGWITAKKFLEDQEKGSTVFVAFGSEAALSQEDVSELALGLELSGVPFIWALRKRQGLDSLELPQGFEERVKGRGLVWTSWAPQLKILGHDAIGGFFSHCGFSSMREALYFGRAMIMMPLDIDQGFSARFFEDKKVGIEVPRNEEDGLFSRESVAETVRLVVVEKEGEIYRENAKKMRTLFADKQLHDGYVDRFAQFLQKSN